MLYKSPLPALYCAVFVLVTAPSALLAEEQTPKDEDIDWDDDDDAILGDDDDDVTPPPGDDDTADDSPAADDDDSSPGNDAAPAAARGASRDGETHMPPRDVRSSPEPGSSSSPGGEYRTGPAFINVPPGLAPIWEGGDGDYPSHPTSSRHGRFMTAKQRCDSDELPGIRGTPAQIQGGELAQMDLDRKRAVSVAPDGWNNQWVYVVGTSTFGSAVIYCVDKEVVEEQLAQQNAMANSPDDLSGLYQRVDDLENRPPPEFPATLPPAPHNHVVRLKETVVPFGAYVSGGVATWGPNLEAGVMAFFRFTRKFDLVGFGGVGMGPAIRDRVVNLSNWEPAYLSAHFGGQFRWRLSEKKGKVRWDLVAGGVETNMVRFSHGWRPYQASLSVPLGAGVRLPEGFGLRLAVLPGLFAGRVPLGYSVRVGGETHYGPGWFVAPQVGLHLEVHWMWTGWWSKAQKAESPGAAAGSVLTGTVDTPGGADIGQ